MKSLTLFPKNAGVNRFQHIFQIVSSPFSLKPPSKPALRRNRRWMILNYEGRKQPRWASTVAKSNTSCLTSSEETYLTRLFLSLKEEKDEAASFSSSSSSFSSSPGVLITAAEASCLSARLWAACAADGLSCPLAVLNAAYHLRREFHHKNKNNSRKEEKKEINTSRGGGTLQKETNRGGIHYQQAYQLLLRYHAVRGRAGEGEKGGENVVERGREGLRIMELFFRTLLIDGVEDTRETAEVCCTKNGGAIAFLLLEGLREWEGLLKERRHELHAPERGNGHTNTHSPHHDGGEAGEFPLLSWLLLSPEGGGGNSLAWDAKKENEAPCTRFAFAATPAEVRNIARFCLTRVLLTSAAAEGFLLFWQLAMQPCSGCAFARAASKLKRKLAHDHHQRRRKDASSPAIDFNPHNRGETEVEEATAFEGKARLESQIRSLLSNEEGGLNGTFILNNPRESMKLKEVATTYAVCVWLRENGEDQALRTPKEYLEALSEISAVFDEGFRNKEKGSLLLAPCTAHLYANAKLQMRILHRQAIPFAVWIVFDMLQSLRELHATEKEKMGLQSPKWCLHTLDAIEFLQKLLLLVDSSPSARIQGGKKNNPNVYAQNSLQMLWYVILKEACEGSFASFNGSANVFPASSVPKDSVEVGEIAKFRQIDNYAGNRTDWGGNSPEKGSSGGRCAVLSRLVLPQYRPSLWRRPTVNLFIRLLHQWNESGELRRVFNQIRKQESKRMNEAWDWIQKEQEEGGKSSERNEKDARSIPTEENPRQDSSFPRLESRYSYVPALTLRSCEIILVHCLTTTTTNNNKKKKNNDEPQPSPNAEIAHEVVQYMLLSLRLLKFRREKFANEGESESIGAFPRNDDESVEEFVEKWVQRIQREYIPKLPHPT